MKKNTDFYFGGRKENSGLGETMVVVVLMGNILAKKLLQKRIA
jgi:hypothetical protein